MEITGAQIRAARALLDVTMDVIVKRTGLSKPSIVRIERGDPVQARTRSTLRVALESLGIEFTEGEGVKRRSNGVRLREMGEAAE